MSFYNMVFGKNPMSDVLLATLGLTQASVGRFRQRGEDLRRIGIFWREELVPVPRPARDPVRIYKRSLEGDEALVELADGGPIARGAEALGLLRGRTRRFLQRDDGLPQLLGDAAPTRGLANELLDPVRIGRSVERHDRVVCQSQRGAPSSSGARPAQRSVQRPAPAQRQQPQYPPPHTDDDIPF